MIDKNKIKTRYQKRNEQIKNEYDRISLVLPKGYKDKIKTLAASENKTLNQFICDLINEKLT